MLLSRERRKALQAKAESLAGNLAEAVPYLEGRGITKEAAAMFSLGFVPKNAPEYASRLSIPYLTPSGAVQIKYRCTNLAHDAVKHRGIDCPKYLFEAGCGTHLFNAQILIHASDLVVVTEGELDAICVQAYCGIPAVAYPGVDTWGKQAHYPLCFEGITSVVVIADGDRQGRDSARRVAEDIGPHARVVNMPDDLDSNEFIATNGVAAFTERIQP